MSRRPNSGPITAQAVRVREMRQLGWKFKDIGKAEGFTGSRAQQIFNNPPREYTPLAQPESLRGNAVAFGCPSCRHAESAVVDSRAQVGYIRRRRMCDACGFRFTTHETVQVEIDPMESFDAGI